MFPKKIHLTCKDKNNIGNKCWESCLQKYKQMYPDYEIRVYDNDDIYAIIETHFPQHVADVKKITIGAVLADIFRYLILYLEGGIYSDMDCEPVRRIDTLLTNIHYHGNDTRNFYIYPRNKKLVTALWDFYKNPCDHCTLVNKGTIEKYKCLGHRYVNKNTNVILCYEFHPIYRPSHGGLQICQWFMMSQPKQQLFLDTYHECIKNIKVLQTITKKDANYQKTILQKSGPKLLTKMVKRNIYRNITILPTVFFCTRNRRNTKNMYVRHLYTGSWK